MRLIATLLALTLFSGCAGTRGGRNVETAGFLGDYSQLSENPDDGVSLRYLQTRARWEGYDKVLLDPVQFWRGADVEAGLSPEQAQDLANYFYRAVHERLSPHYEMVHVPQSATLRISLAFTRLGERNVTLDTVSTYLPAARVLSEAKGGLTGKASFVGDAAFEAKITDAETGELLGAAVDKRVGGKTVKNFDNWSDVRAASDLWAKSLAYRLCVLRGGRSCTAP